MWWRRIGGCGSRQPAENVRTPRRASNAPWCCTATVFRRHGWIEVTAATLGARRSAADPRSIRRGGEVDADAGPDLEQFREEGQFQRLLEETHARGPARAALEADDAHD